MKVQSSQQLSLQVLKQFRLIYGAVRQHFREVEQTCEVSGSQLWLMQEIGRTPEIGVSELAGRLSIHQSTCSLLVDKLVARGHVTKMRQQDDQRRVGLRLSPLAAKILLKAPGPAEGVLPEALQALPKAVLKALNLNLDDLIGQLRIRNERHAGKPLADL